MVEVSAPKVKQLHFNKPQLRSLVVGSPSEYLIAGRGTGKSEGVLAPKTATKYLGTMPRGTGVIVQATYNQALVRTLPGLCAGWDRLGYKRDHHYIVGRKPTDKWKKQWKWEGPFRQPFDFKYFISWWNGGGAHIVSQDRPGSSNGITIDWIAGDEAKLLSEEKLKTELFPANRGIIPDFANNPYHHGMTFTTDMPVGTAGRWILNMVDKMDHVKVNEIWQYQVIRFQLKDLLKKEKSNVLKKELAKQIQVIDDEVNELRRNLLYYHEASTLDNIHALGIDYIKQQLRDTSEFQFDTQILNLRPLKLEDGFYPDFDEEVHGYFSVDNNYLDNIDYDFSKLEAIDCKRDKDLDPTLPLHLGIDANRRIHPFSIGQVTKTEIRAIKGIHALYPAKLKEALAEFIRYYKPHPRKLIYFWYDHTMVGDQHETRICDDVVNYLRKHGWVVIEMYIGQQPGHEERYRMWGDLLTESGKYTRRFRINRENCDKLILSMYQAKAEQRKEGFGKDKKSEHDPNFPAEESTHYSDACDTWVFGILESGMTFGNENKGGGGSIVG